MMSNERRDSGIAKDARDDAGRANQTRRKAGRNKCVIRPRAAMRRALRERERESAMRVGEISQCQLCTVEQKLWKLFGRVETVEIMRRQQF